MLEFKRFQLHLYAKQYKNRAILKNLYNFTFQQ